MSAKITRAAAKEFIEFYNNACIQKGEKQDEITRSFVINRESIDEIFASAAAKQIECPKIRIYLGKKTAYDPQTGYPKFSARDNYNLVVVGVNPEGENITVTESIYNHLQPATGVSSTPSGNDF